MNRRGFLMAAGATLPSAAWTSQAQAPARNESSDADLPLRAPSIRVALLHTDVPAIDSRFADTDRKSLLARWLREIEPSANDAAGPDVIVLPDYALTGWQHWTPRELSTVAARLDGPELASLGNAATRANAHVLLGGWWLLDAGRGAPRHCTLLLSPTFEPQVLTASAADAPQTIVRTAVGNWALNDTSLDATVAHRLARAGAEWVVARGLTAAPESRWPLLSITSGRSAGLPPPGCPDLLSDQVPFRSSAAAYGHRLLACSRGAASQTLTFTAPIGALRAARRRVPAAASVADHILG